MAPNQIEKVKAFDYMACALARRGCELEEFEFEDENVWGGLLVRKLVIRHCNLMRPMVIRLNDLPPGMRAAMRLVEDFDKYVAIMRRQALGTR